MNKNRCSYIWKLVVDAFQKSEEKRMQLANCYGEPTFWRENSNGDRTLTGLNLQYFSGIFVELLNPIYEPTEDSFYLYNTENGLWELLSSSFLHHAISALLQAQADSGSDEILQKRSPRLIRDIVELSKALCHEADFFNQPKSLYIHCQNGMLVFSPEDQRWIMKSFSPEFRSRNQNSITYNPEAECPIFLNQLLFPAISISDVDILQKYVGQCLLGKNTSQKFLLLTGTAGGGKSTLINIIEQLVGRQNCTELRLEHLGNRFELQRLIGKSLLTGKDVKSNFLNTPGAYKLKALTGSDIMTIEKKGKNESSDIVGNFNAIIASNNRLSISLDGDYDAWFRRLLWIRYENTPPANPITDFDQKLLKEEGPGILNWALSGATKILLAGGQIKLTDEQRKLIEDYLASSDIVGHFTKTCVERGEKSDTLTVSELHLEFHQFCARQNCLPLPGRIFYGKLGDAMLSLHHVPKRTDVSRDGKNQRGFYGVRLKSVKKSGL